MHGENLKLLGVMLFCTFVGMFKIRPHWATYEYIQYTLKINLIFLRRMYSGWLRRVSVQQINIFSNPLSSS
jgi:hypothetical protein